MALYIHWRGLGLCFVLYHVCSILSTCFVTPWTIACQIPLSMGFSRQEYWSGLPFPPPGDLPDPGVEPTSPALIGRFFTTEQQGEALLLLEEVSNYVTLCDPRACSPPGSSVHGIFQARILEWVAISSSRGSSQPRGRTHISSVSCIGRRVLCH